jgi:hypothetical protein
VHAKAQEVEQSIKTILNREFPKGSALTGIKPSSRVISAPITLHLLHARKMAVNAEKRTSAAVHSPGPKAALTLPKSTPVSSIQALPSLLNLPKTGLLCLSKWI